MRFVLSLALAFALLSAHAITATKAYVDSATNATRTAVRGDIALATNATLAAANAYTDAHAGGGGGLTTNDVGRIIASSNLVSASEAAYRTNTLQYVQSGENKKFVLNSDVSFGTDHPKKERIVKFDFVTGVEFLDDFYQISRLKQNKKQYLPNYLAALDWIPARSNYTASSYHITNVYSKTEINDSFALKTNAIQYAEIATNLKERTSYPNSEIGFGTKPGTYRHGDAYVRSRLDISWPYFTSWLIPDGSDFFTEKQTSNYVEKVVGSVNYGYYNSNVTYKVGQGVVREDSETSNTNVYICIYKTGPGAFETNHWANLGTQPLQDVSSRVVKMETSKQEALATITPAPMMTAAGQRLLSAAPTVAMVTNAISPTVATSVTSASTDAQLATAKATHDAVQSASITNAGAVAVATELNNATAVTVASHATQLSQLSKAISENSKQAYIYDDTTNATMRTDANGRIYGYHGNPSAWTYWSITGYPYYNPFVESEGVYRWNRYGSVVDYVRYYADSGKVTGYSWSYSQSYDIGYARAGLNPFLGDDLTLTNYVSGSGYIVYQSNTMAPDSAPRDSFVKSSAITGIVESAIDHTQPHFSNEVLAVGLGIGTNEVAQINAILADSGGTPVGSATTVGGLLAALAAAVAWLRRKKVGKITCTGADDIETDNGTANVSALFTSANTSNNAENVRTSAADATPISTVIAGKITNPSGGSAGNVLKKTADGVEWGTGGGGGTTIQYDSQTGRYYFET